jgi:DNA-binding IclR family transcriptional regulator
MPRRAEVSSVDRALALLDALAVAGSEGARVTDLAARLEVDKSTVSRLLSTLARRGYADRLPNRRFGLGPTPVELVTSRIGPAVQRAAPHLARVAAMAGETVYLIQLIGREAVTIARLESSRRAPLVFEDRAAYPLWATSAGMALLSAQRPIERMRLLPPEPYPRFTARTATTARELWARIRRGLRDGIFAEEAEYMPRSACYAVRLLDGRVDGDLALAISFEASRPESERARLREALLRGARSINGV